jgi:cytochrome c oxidase subunit 4
MSHASSDNHELGHTVPFSVHFTILLTLLALTIVTVWVSRHDFGTWNIVVAMLIASFKAGLVGLFFMHLKYENPLIWVYVAFPLLLLVVMIGGLFLDNPTRYVPGKDSYHVEGFAIGGLKHGAEGHGTGKAEAPAAAHH